MVTVIRGGDVVTMDPGRRVLRGGSVVVGGDTILAVGSTTEAAGRFPGADVVDADGCLVTPGLVDAHQHLTGDPLIRCCIPDHLTGNQAIFDWAVPVHAHHDSDDDRVAATLAAAEAALNGVTTVVEAGTVADADAVADAVQRIGIRIRLGVWGWDVGDGPFAAPAAEVLARQREVVARYPAGGLVEGWVTLVGHDLASDELFAGAADLARSTGVGLTFHLSPSSTDAASYLERTGRRPVAHLDRLGVLGPHLLLAHAVWLDDGEVELILDHGVGVASCPWAYLRLAQGITRAGRHGDLLLRGGRVAVGCDAGNAGDRIDVLQAAALLVGLVRDASGDPTGVGAHTALEVATIGGAAAIGAADRIGSIEVGKQADLVIHRCDRPGSFPVGDPAHQLVWGGDGRTVRDVFVAGRRIVADGEVTGVDVAALRVEATGRRRALLERAGIRPVPRWPEIDAR